MKNYLKQSFTLYKYDVNNLDYKEVKTLYWFISTIIVLLIIISLSSFVTKTKYLKQETETIYRRDIDFTYQKLIDEIKKLKLEHPEIVLAQAITESGHFKHERFKFKSNLFGMKKSGDRISTCLQYDDAGFCIYKNWHESLMDYALRQTAFARGYSEKEYYESLVKYCPDKGYEQLIKDVVEDNKLKELFN